MQWIAVVAILAVVHEMPLAAEEQSPPEVAAVVNGQPVHWAEVEYELRRAFGKTSAVAAGGDPSKAPATGVGPSKAADAKRRAAALSQVIDRRLVLGYLQRTSQAASEQDVDFALARLEKDLQAQGRTVSDHARAIGLAPEQLRRELAWQLSWQRYLDKQQSDANLAKYFDRHRREFDGTTLRVAQILLKPASEKRDATDALIELAQSLRAEIVSGKITFADAARRHSAAPSAAAGGDIGWIERHKPMPEDFSHAAFALKVGEVSQPLQSPFGVHLITVLEEKSGTKTWQDVADELRPAVALYLFRWIASRERQGAKIELHADPNDG